MDKGEAFKFVQATLGSYRPGKQISMETFEYVFKLIDKDGSGTIDKSEMCNFIKQFG